MKKRILLLLCVATTLATGPLSARLVHSVDRPHGMYELTASDHYQFLWVRLAKNGSRSTVAILKEHMGDHLDHDPKGNKWSKYDDEKFGDYFKAVFVRNPWDRVVSAYFNKVVDRKGPYLKECIGMSFDEFIDWLDQQDLAHADIHVQPQVNSLPNGIELDFIGRMESYSEDIETLLGHFGIDPGQIPHRNSSRHTHYSHYYTEQTKEIVRRLYAEDIAAFGYEFEYEEESSS